ncbi:NAD(P)-dependent oxidoreductase [Saccharopolyspora rosea]|uniref:NAD-dependent epimerase/dehydratase family protein n=1 Tax=Saccharopolyspora rosea TaxID=524884 RepID=A0ABW3FQU5_9PSEU
MTLRVVVAGASRVVGGPLLARLRERGHHVTALVGGPGDFVDPDRVDEVVVAEPDDARALRSAVRDAAPDALVDLAADLAAGDGEVLRDCARRGRETADLVAAATAAGARRVVAQSSTGAYRPCGREVLDESAPLWTDATGVWGEVVRSLSAAEQAVLGRPDVAGVVLRYGSLYGPGTRFAPGGAVHEQVRGSALPLVEDGVGLTSFTHVDDAAQALVEVLDQEVTGTYNVVDNEPAECAEWLPAYARMAGGPAPVTLSLDKARAQLDALTVHQLTEQRAATNFRIREELGWRPAWPSWREGFAEMFGLWPV